MDQVKKKKKRMKKKVKKKRKRVKGMDTRGVAAVVTRM